MSTPHNAAEKGQIADIVLMPGDPARAGMIAREYLENVAIVSSVRGNNCYTGYYKGKRVSVMASGMGQPSLGIYAYELFTEYEVKSIIRVGTAGSYIPELKVNQVFVAESAFSESSFAHTMSGYERHITYPCEDLNRRILSAAASLQTPVRMGRIHSSDCFYRVTGPGYMTDLVENQKCECVEMESFALFHIAAVLGKEAACLTTISDSFVAPEILTPEQRQNSLHTMIRIALEACVTK